MPCLGDAVAPAGVCVCFQWLELRRPHGRRTWNTHKDSDCRWHTHSTEKLPSELTRRDGSDQCWCRGGALCSGSNPGSCAPPGTRPGLHWCAGQFQPLPDQRGMVTAAGMETRKSDQFQDFQKSERLKPKRLHQLSFNKSTPVNTSIQYTKPATSSCNLIQWTFCRLLPARCGPPPRYRPCLGSCVL